MTVRGWWLAGLTGLVAVAWFGVASVRGAALAEVVYVANANDGPVFAYDASSSGQISASNELDNPNLMGTFWLPWGVAADGGGSVYVQTFLSNATSFVFPPGAQAGTPPSRVFRGDGPDSRAIAVDSNGYAYVATSQHNADIVVLPPGAAGQPENLYSVQPLRTIPTDESIWYPWPGILSTDTSGDVIAALTRFQGNAIEVFQGGPTGSGIPSRIIAGPDTGLGATPDRVVVSYSAYTGLLYVGVSGLGGATMTHVSIFAGDANGDAAPIATISGPTTDLAGRVITGIANSQLDGAIYVMVKNDQFGGAGFVAVYDPFAQGDVAPVREFTDIGSWFVDAQAIALAQSDPGLVRPASLPPGFTRTVSHGRERAHGALPDRLQRAPATRQHP
jgi:hypothetical protein